MGDRDLMFGQDQLDIAQAQAEHVIKPDGVPDDLGREGGKLWGHPPTSPRRLVPANGLA
ncbi:MAG TPA: hypothetical protein VNZ61_14485 [Roseomonas sp.]|nr:hypothetical protein [Roseomonas sp.]